MDTNQLIEDNPHKQRTVDDIVRFLKTRVERNPNYCLLLGAGCSVTSGIPSGGELIDRWRREVFHEHSEKGEEYSTEKAKKLLKERFSQWYSENNEYSSLFEKKYDLPSQRRKFIEEIVSERIPSIGYAYLVNLVKNNFLNSIFTTNFDDLLNEAFYHYSDRRPMLCAHDSSVTSINLYSSRPKIIKLHGDYLFDDIKGSLRETESLEQNTKNKLVETLKGQGLIAVGYAGHDRSVMDVLSYLLRLEDHLSNGVYWCIRKGETISEEVKKLLWRDKVYYVLIDGFDEFFAELNSKLTNTLALEQNLTNNKTSKIIESYTTNKYLLQSTSEIIKTDIDRLSKQKTKSNISRLIQELNDKEQNNLDDNEIAALMTIEALLQDENYETAIKQCQEALSKDPNKEMQTALTRLLAKSYAFADMNEKAIECNEQLKKWEPNDPRPYTAIASIESRIERKLEILDEAIAVAPYDHLAYDKKAIILIEKSTHLPCAQKTEMQFLARDALEKSIKLSPSFSNPSWGRFYDLIQATDMPSNNKKQLLSELISRLDEQGPFNPRSISLKTFFHSQHCDEKEQLSFFNSLRDYESKIRRTEIYGFKKDQLKAAQKFNYDEESKELIDEIIEQADEHLDSEAITAAGRVLAEQFGDFERAAETLKNSKSISTNYDSLNTLIVCQILIDDPDGIRKTLDIIKSNFSTVAYLRAAASVYDFQGNPEKAIAASKQLIELTKDRNKYISLHAYNHIKNKEPEIAKKMLSEFLTENNFDRNLISEIVNFEICKKVLGGKCDKVRLGEILNHASADLEKSVIHSLLEDSEKSLESLKAAVKKDKTDIISALHWPAFDSIRGEKEFTQIVESTVKSKRQLTPDEQAAPLRVVH